MSNLNTYVVEIYDSHYTGLEDMLLLVEASNESEAEEQAMYYLYDNYGDYLTEACYSTGRSIDELDIYADATECNDSDYDQYRTNKVGVSKVLKRARGEWTG